MEAGGSRAGVDTDWLREVLAPGRASAIDGIELNQLDVNVGLLSSLTRARVTSSDSDIPTSVIIKQASDNEANDSIAHQFGYYAREVGAFRDVLPSDQRWLPRCYHASLDADGAPTLVLQDLGDHRPGDQLSGLDHADANAMIDTAATFHARFWNDPQLATLDWLPSPTSDVVTIYRDLFSMMWPGFLDTFGPAMPTGLLSIAAQAMTRFDEALERFAAGPLTLVHGDYRLDNVLFRGPVSAGDTATTGNTAAVAIDWQLAARSCGPYDLAFLLAGSADPDWRSENERPLLERYHKALVANGVTDYPFERCWDDYRFGHIVNLPNPITAAVAVEATDERAARFLEANARRALYAVAHHWG